MEARTGLLQGTLHLLILRALSLGPDLEAETAKGERVAAAMASAIAATS
jgi:hypothetical protein